MQLSRRGFFTGLAALVAAPAIVRVENLMMLPAPKAILLPEGLVEIRPTFLDSKSLLTINQITREGIKLWKNSNTFIEAIDRAYDAQFSVEGARIGSQLLIRLPKDFVA